MGAGDVIQGLLACQLGPFLESLVAGELAPAARILRLQFQHGRENARLDRIQLTLVGLAAEDLLDDLLALRLHA
ncbi:hypothetical protein FIV34_04090 [Luteibacter pinisoli]|uniref:Uncharacterized protein n=1 Tax=Luteibacter pinisoli TaxID=2589080 RepID=A0A4Y5Z055_9GAMM|nr:hypothetical protein [Luteibacter pinisoli]QDE38437.1 hypothetical protein FIV34_04090 [Luteibacter pinisoli]